MTPEKVVDLSRYHNAKTLNEAFFVVYNEKYGGGYAYKCKKCGSLANCKEFFCKFIDFYVPEWVICSQFPMCKGHWRRRM